MATTGQNFGLLINPASVGDAYQAAGTAVSYLPNDETSEINSGAVTALDNLGASNFANDAFAKHGFGIYTLSGTTPVNADLTNLATASASTAGDTVFASFSTLILYNTGGADVTVAPGASNPASIGLGGTTPTLTVKAGKAHVLQFAAAVVDGTHKIITITPTAGGSFALGVAGA